MRSPVARVGRTLHGSCGPWRAAASVRHTSLLVPDVHLGRVSGLKRHCRGSVRNTSPGEPASLPAHASSTALGTERPVSSRESAFRRRIQCIVAPQEGCCDHALGCCRERRLKSRHSRPDSVWPRSGPAVLPSSSPQNSEPIKIDLCRRNRTISLATRVIHRASRDDRNRSSARDGRPSS